MVLLLISELILLVEFTLCLQQTQPPAVFHKCVRQQRRQQRFDRYERVVELYKQGYSQRAIGNELGIGRKTVRRWLRSGQFPERKPARVTEFADYLQCRWNDGCHNATRLYEEIRHKGYTGKRSMVANFVSSCRHTGTTKRAQCPATDRTETRYDSRHARRRSDDRRTAKAL